MSWIRTIGPDVAGPELLAVYQRVLSSRGKVSDIMRVQSLAPRAMGAHLDLYLALLFGPSPLSRGERETVAVTVSVANDCEYCIAHHRAALLAHRRDASAVDRLVADPATADLDTRGRAIVNYALRLTRSVSFMAESDVESLRLAGLSDEEILHVNLITGYLNFANRLAEGLGVRPAPYEVEGYRYE